MEKPYSIEKIKAMQYPTRQDMREAIWYLIELIESQESKPLKCNHCGYEQLTCFRCGSKNTLYRVLEE